MVEVILYILAGAALFGAGQRLALGVQDSSKRRYFLHSAMYLLLALFAVGSAVSYTTQSLPMLINVGKLGISAGFALWAALPWLIAWHTRFKPRLPLVALTVAWILLLIGNIGAPYSLLYSEISVVSQMMPNGQPQLVLQSRGNPWWALAQIAMLCALLFSLYAVWRLYQDAARTRVFILGAGLTVLLGASICDALINWGHIQSAYLSPFGFFALLVAVGLSHSRQPFAPARTATAPDPYRMTFHLDRPRRLETGRVVIDTAAPARTLQPVADSEAQVSVEPHPLHEKPAKVSEQPASSHRSEADGSASDAGNVRPVSDREALTIVSDNLIDIAVHATMAINRFKGDGGDPATLQTLFEKVRSQAMDTRRIANRIMHGSSGDTPTREKSASGED